KFEQHAQMRDLEVVARIAIDAPAAHRDDRTLALEQALRTAFGIAEGDPCAQHVVEPGLQGRAYAEIVHRRADDDRVRLRQLRDEGVRQFTQSRLVGIGRRAKCGHRVRYKVRDRVRVEIAANDLRVRRLRAQLYEHVFDELVRDGVAAKRTAGEDEGGG